MSSPTEWYKDNFFVSTKASLIQPDAVNAAFDTKSLYWCRPMDEDVVKKMLDNSMCFGVYELPKSSAEIVGRANPRQIGLARLVTDEVTIAYLTDVYILEEYQGKGLGTWLIQCVNEALSTWPKLRRVMLISSHGSDFYEKYLGVEDFKQGVDGLMVMSRRGPGSTMNQ